MNRIEMIEEEIPDETERFCVDCSSSSEELDYVETKQVPVSIEVHQGSRGCFSPRAKIQWKWECQECGEIQR